ncbi:MAG: T9SS type A sorting domain-containing protein, partial [Candidatus Marinimicrobia bacterium]|nr:T9SS type A sorting domain-containing protein [Candidatus Neomarinimicrobiota bacterium]
GEVHRIGLTPMQTTIPTEYALPQNFPNPFNPNTNIQYQLPVANHVSLVIYNALGERIRTLVNEVKDKGYYSVSWNGENDQYKAVSSGIYFYQIKTGNFTQTQKMIFLR